LLEWSTIFVETILQLDLSEPAINYLPDNVYAYVKKISSIKTSPWEKSKSPFANFWPFKESISLDWWNYAFWMIKPVSKWNYGNLEDKNTLINNPDKTRIEPAVVIWNVKFKKWLSQDIAREKAEMIVRNTWRENLKDGVSGIIEYYEKNPWELIIDVASIIISVALAEFTAWVTLELTATKLAKLYRLVKVAWWFTIYNNVISSVWMWVLEYTNGWDFWEWFW
jgi:hypothetical protein